MKTCTGCQQSLPEADFPIRKKSPDGLSPKCRICKSKADADLYARKKAGAPTATRLTLVQKIAIVEQGNAGAHARDLAAKFGISRESVYAIWKQGGVAVKENTYLTQEEEGEIAALRQSGMAIADICIKTGHKASTVRWCLSKAGVVLTQEQRNTNMLQHAPEKLTKAVQLRRQGVPMREIVAQVNIPKGTLKDVFRDEGVKLTQEQITANVVPARMDALLDKNGVSSFAEWMQKHADKFGGRYVGGYTTVLEPCQWECKEGHAFSKRPNDVQQGVWCPACFLVGRSAGQLEAYEYVKSLCPDAVLGDRTQIGPLELDVYVPSKQFALEYNGLYWHSSAMEGYRRNKHRDKALACRDKGIKLLMIFEDEWANKQDLVKAMIRWRLGKFNGHRRSAGKLTLKKVTNKEMKPFFDRNHLDGHTIARWGYGLFENGTMVMCASVRTNHQSENEIARMATDYDWSVLGGASRIIKAIKAEVEGPLVSFSNNRLSSGDVYEKAGFRWLQDNAPSYWYTEGTKRIWRYRCRRINEPDVLAKYPTEKAQALGGVFGERILGKAVPFYEIADAGHRKWVL